MRTRFNEMMAKTDPPEPTCPRCQKYVHDEDCKYCPCGAELDLDNNKDNDTLICPTCGKLLKHHEIEWKCYNCGYDGKEHFCVVCNALLHPRESDMCAKCQAKEYQQAVDCGLYEAQLYGKFEDEEGGQDEC